MIARLASKRTLLAAIAAVAFAFSVPLLLPKAASPRLDRTPQPPLLFGDPPVCGAHASPRHRATRAERQGHLHVDRYPYDPLDGISAVLRFQEASNCYRQLGLDVDADRAQRLASALIARIDVDYASSRLALQRALDAESWRAALVEARRILRLTEHLQGHDYVEHLSGLMGKVTARAADHE